MLPSTAITIAGSVLFIPILFGGEPLIREDIGRVIRAIKERNRYCIIYTNGSLVPDKIKDILLVDQLVISIDGWEATNDNIRGKGAYQKAIKALEIALNHGLVFRAKYDESPDCFGEKCKISP